MGAEHELIEGQNLKLWGIAFVIFEQRNQLAVADTGHWNGCRLLTLCARSGSSRPTRYARKND
jgi:hypothetical protein